MPALLLTALVAIGCAALGSLWLTSWQGWYPAPGAALPGPEPHIIVYTRTVPGAELVLYRSDDRGLSLAGFRRSRQGYQLLFDQRGLPPNLPPTSAAAQVTTTEPLSRDRRRLQTVTFGELLDSRAAYLELGGRRYPVGKDGPYFILTPDGCTATESASTAQSGPAPALTLRLMATPAYRYYQAAALPFQVQYVYQGGRLHRASQAAWLRTAGGPLPLH